MIYSKYWEEKTCNLRHSTQQGIIQNWRKEKEFLREAKMKSSSILHQPQRNLKDPPQLKRLEQVVPMEKETLHYERQIYSKG